MNQPFDEADNMCPNCVTPWKCNGPHLYEQTVAAREPHVLTIDEAWRATEAVLPQGWYISNVRRRSLNGRHSASATLDTSLTGESMSGFGATPVEALLALRTRFTTPPFTPSSRVGEP